MIKTLKDYQINFIKNDIKMYEIVATSAFRDTQNSEEARRYVENEIVQVLHLMGFVHRKCKPIETGNNICSSYLNLHKVFF